MRNIPNDYRATSDYRATIIISKRRATSDYQTLFQNPKIKNNQSKQKVNSNILKVNTL